MTERFWRGCKAVSLVALAALAACGDDGSTYRAEIRRTSMGVPHIKADNWAGVGYGYGYVQAEDNLCSMADAFLTYRGERSKHFGGDALVATSPVLGEPKNIDSDFFHKHVITAETVDAMMKAQPKNLQKMVQGFAAGYNRYVREIQAGGSAAAHAACRSEVWLGQITATDIYRRMYQTTVAAGYGVFVPHIANATPPAVVAQASGRLVAMHSAPLEIRSIDVPGLQGIPGESDLGSNAIAFGTAATGTNSPLMFSNPHWYWRSADRFYQVHLTIPGKLNVSGASMLNNPVITMGFNDAVAWAHTVSTAQRFGFFQLELASGDPTSYVRDGADVKMQAAAITVDVKQPDGTVTPVSRTLYKSEYGPIVDLTPLNPAFAWNQTTAFALRDINAENYRVNRNSLRWAQAKSLDEFIAIQREEAAAPFVNTLAAGRGSAKAWYADIGAIPNVSPEQVATCTTPFGQAVAASLPRVPFFDGSRSACDWQSDPDSVQKGAIGPARMPSLLRDDYVANMNDSYWLANPKAPLTGFPAIIGPAGTEALSLRTRLGLAMAQGRLDGTDGYPGNKATVDAVKQMVLNSRAHSAELFKAQALPMVCAAPQILVTGDPQTEEVFSPARAVDVAAACSALQAWDNAGNIDSRGAHVWDEFWARAVLLPAAQLYGVPFSAADPLGTPRDLKPEAAASLQQAFGAAVLRVQQSGYAVDAARGEYLFVNRGGTKIPLYGGCGNPQGYFTLTCSNNRLDKGGYDMDVGNPFSNSYVQIVTFPASGVEAHTFMAYSQSDDPASTHYADYTRAYSAKRWVRMPFTEAQITADPDYQVTTLRE